MTHTHAWPAIYQGELLPDPDPDESIAAVAEMPAPDREVHDWDGATGTVTTYLRFAVGDHHVWGAGLGRNRDEARLRATASAARRIASTVEA